MGYTPMVASDFWGIPSGKHTKNYGKSPFFMGKSTISMAMFNSKLSAITRGYPIHFFCDPWKTRWKSRQAMDGFLPLHFAAQGGWLGRWGRLIGFSGNQAWLAGEFLTNEELNGKNDHRTKLTQWYNMGNFPANHVWLPVQENKFWTPLGFLLAGWVVLFLSRRDKWAMGSVVNPDVPTDLVPTLGEEI